jgi:hypothetical protein
MPPGVSEQIALNLIEAGCAQQSAPRQRPRIKEL